MIYMKYVIRGPKMEVTDAIKNYIESKVGKLDKYFETPDNITANVLVSAKGKKQKVEVTIPVKKIILRAEVEHEDLYASIDLVTDKLEGQIRKNKSRIKKQTKNIKEFNVDYVVEPEENEESVIVKRKTIEMKPMDEEEAILQMNLLDHDFFIFKDESSETVSILYRRKDGNYGIIETK